MAMWRQSEKEAERSPSASEEPATPVDVALSAPAFRLLLLLVVSASASAQLWTHSAHFTFEYENDWLLGIARRLGAHFELHSSPIGPTGLDHGPLFFLLTWPIVALIPDPMALQFVWVGLASVGAAVMGFALARQVGRVPSLLGVVGLTTSWFWFDASRALWHSSLLPLPMALFLTGLFNYVREGRAPSLAGAGLAAAVCVQLHAQSAYLGLVFLIVLAWALPRRGVRHVLGPALLTGLALAPFLASAASRWASDAAAGHVPSTGASIADGVTWASAVLRMASPAPSGDGASVAGSVWLLLASAGVMVTAVRRQRWMLVLTACFLLGLVSSLFLLGWGGAPRYLHTLAMPTFALASVAVGEALASLDRRLELGTLASRLVVVASVASALIAAFMSAHPGFTPPLLNAESQRVLAAELRRVTADRRRIHGYDDSDRSLLTGTGYVLGLTWPAPSAPLAEDEALVVLPAGLQLPVSRPVSVVHLATTPTRLDVFRSRPRVRLTGVNGREPPRVFGSDVLDVRQLDESPTFTIAGHVSDAGPFVVQLRRTGQPEGCPVRATVGHTTLEARPITTTSGFEHLLVSAPSAGPLTLHVGPCEGEVQIDAF